MNLSHPPRRTMIWLTLGLTVLIELICVVLRFGWGLESTHDTASTIGVLTFGIRIHHGYCGLVLLLIAWGTWTRYPRLARWGVILGMALFLSDMVHHFLVLWPITGSPHFDLVYPPVETSRVWDLPGHPASRRA